MFKIENKTTWDTKQLTELFSLISKKEGYYPRKIYVTYSGKRDVPERAIGGKATYGPGWVKMTLPNTDYLTATAVYKHPILKGKAIEQIARIYIHELDHNRRLRHREMANWTKFNVDYVKGIKIYRMEVKKEPTRVRLKTFYYKGKKVKSYKYPYKVKGTDYSKKPPKHSTGYYYSFLIYDENNKRIDREQREYMENKQELKKHIKKRIDNYIKRYAGAKKGKVIKSTSLIFHTFNDFFNWFNHNVANELKLSYANDYRDKTDLDTGEQYIVIFMDYDFKKVIEKLSGVSNLKYAKDKYEYYRIYLMEE